MNDNNSAVAFATDSRIHFAFGAKDLAQTTAFYRALFGIEPVKVKDDYVKFEVAEPPLNLSLHPVAEPVVSPVPEHFGVQVKSTKEVARRAEALEAAGHPLRREDEVTCCYAVQDKVWAADPDGRAWEVYVVLQAETEVHSDKGAMAGQGEPCCEPEQTTACCA